MSDVLQAANARDAGSLSAQSQKMTKTASAPDAKMLSRRQHDATPACNLYPDTVFCDSRHCAGTGYGNKADGA